MKPKVLVVDDERDIVNLVRYNFEKEGYEIISCYDGASVLALVWQHRPDVIVLDLMLPDRSGYTICKEIKADPATRGIPVIMLTARSSEHDRITGFESGAEDYVVKPFSPRELVLRVKAMLGRTRKTLPDVIETDRLKLIPEEFRVLVDGEEVSLTQIEFRILMMLATQPNVVKNREQILSGVWENDAEEILDRTVDAHVKRLRTKLGNARDCIETVRGIGYKMVSLPKAGETGA